MSVLWLALSTPLLLLFLMVGMERVERSLRLDSIGDELETFLAAAQPDEVEAFVSQGYSVALEQYWRSRRGRGA